MNHEVSPLRFAILLAMLAATLGSGATEPSQSPLVTRVGEIPKPNVMVIVDDSGSMLEDYMPEQTFTLNGKAIAISKGKSAGAFPGDPRKTVDCVAVGDKLTITNGAAAELIYQHQYRSPDVNTIFYNPDIRYLPWVNPSGGRMANSVPSAAKWDPSLTSTFNLTAAQTNVNIGWCTTSTATTTGKKGFAPGLVYRLTAGADPTVKTNYKRYDVNVNGEQSPTTKHANRTDCASTRCTVAEEQQNFANWFTYYRMREQLVKAAVSETFTNFNGKLRAGWGAINAGSKTIDGKSFTVIQQAIRDLDTAHLNTMLTGIQAVSSNGGTPLRTALDTAGKYFKDRTDAGSPWYGTPGTTTSGKLACRRSAVVMLTDGYYNDTYSAAGDVDGVNGPDYSLSNPGGYSVTRYIAARPYIDGATKYSNTLADVAMKYFVNDLDTTIANSVAPTNDDIAFWQHLTVYTIGVGVVGRLDASTQATKMATIAAMKAGTKDWPNPGDPNNVNTYDPLAEIDDMWHAAVNTGGDFYSIKNVTELGNALKDSFGNAVGAIAREAGVATTAATLTTDLVKFVPKYRSVAWWGDVEAYDLDSFGNVPSGATPKWSALAQLPAASARNLYTWDGTAAVSFLWASIGATNQGLIVDSTLLDYIRGDTSREGQNNLYRSRGGKLLADFVNSPPVLVKGLLDLKYNLLSDSTLATSYATYLTSKKARSEGVLFVGGNGGMVHGFLGSTGAEIFGFLPQEGLGKLSLIGQQDYGTSTNFHRYFVDGPMIEADAYIVPRGELSARWTNMVVGAMGSGGKSVFAFHIPTTNPTALAANNVQWELRNDADLGYVLSDIRIGKVQGTNGGWYAFVGNGAYSTNGNAVLLVINLQTGAIAKRIQVPTSGANGLGGVRLLRNSHQEVYAAYAGDLQGNMWRFDFEGAASTTWSVSFSNKPLYRAANSSSVAQPISAAPAIYPHPTKGGRLVLFGTGKLLDDADATSTDIQSFYGVWDNTRDEVSATNLASPFHTHESNELGTPFRNDLVAQTIGTTAIAGVGDNSFYTVSTNSVDWNSKKGWYVDLTISSRQRVTFTAQTVLSNVYFTTTIPAGNVLPCEVGTGGSYSFALSALTGSALEAPPFDVNGDGVVSSADAVDTNHDGRVDSSDGKVAAYKTSADGVDKLLGQQDGLVSSEDGVISTDLPVCAPTSKCPPNYCLIVIVNTTNTAQELCVGGQVPNTTKVVTDRVWRQVVQPPAP